MISMCAILDYAPRGGAPNFRVGRRRMEVGTRTGEPRAEAEWELLTLRGLAMSDETASEFTGTLVIHRKGSAEPVEQVGIRVKRTVLEEMSAGLQRLLARSARYKR